MPSPDFTSRIETLFNSPVKKRRSLHGGCVAEVYRVDLANGQSLVAKVDSSEHPRLGIEGFMLDYLKTHSPLPVPAVYHNSGDLLVMEFLPGDSCFSAGAQEHAAELLAAVHQVSAPQYGFEKETVIGGLPQPNPWTSSWLDFFREHRILFMAKRALEEKSLPNAPFRRLEKFCENLERWLEEPVQPSLLHGDVWTTNVLAEKDRITGFIDPAIYYGHPEIELAFSTLFGTFSEPFFKRYDEINGIAPGFFEIRRDLYNLYPLLVHVRLFGGSYVRSIESILGKIGC